MRKRSLVPTMQLHTTVGVAAHQQAVELARLRGFRDMNSFLEQLIREDYERRKGPIVFTEARPAKSKGAARKETSGERRDRIRREHAN